MQYGIQRATLALFACYAALLPGSITLMAINQVPTWGLGFGGTLLLLQGATMLAWLVWRYGQRGLIAGVVIAALGFGIEYIGETTGFPFGRYTYTELVQPQLSTVPLAICAAWMMTATASYEIAQQFVKKRFGMNGVLLVTATLVLLQDLQIETVASLISNYWVWIDSGVYYGVPTTNFVAWWLVGLAMAFVYSKLVKRGAVSRDFSTTTRFGRYEAWLITNMPTVLYLLSTLMFTSINLARGYTLAGCVGLIVLMAAAMLWGYLRKRAAANSASPI